MPDSALSARKKRKNIEPGLMIFVLVSVVLLADQLTKSYLNKSLSLNQSIPVIRGIFHLSLVHNRGAAFGIFKGQLILFIFTSLVAIFLLACQLKQNKRPSLYNFSLALILAGGIGNLIDRLLYGYVIDFLDLRIWPVFNIADSSITIGAVLLGWSICFQKSAK